MCRRTGAGPPPCSFGASYLCDFDTVLYQIIGVWAVQLLTKPPDLTSLQYHQHSVIWNKHQEKTGVMATETQPLASDPVNGEPSSGSECHRGTQGPPEVRATGIPKPRKQLTNPALLSPLSP